MRSIPSVPPAGSALEAFPIGTKIRRRSGIILEVHQHDGDKVILRWQSHSVGWLYRSDSVMLLSWAVRAGLYSIVEGDGKGHDEDGTGSGA